MTALPYATVTVETLPVIAYQGVRVLTTDLLAKLYGASAKNIQDNYQNNSDRFEQGKHHFKLEGDALRQFKDLHRPDSNGSVQISPRVKALTLWTERGAARHAKMLDTEKAWDVFERLEDSYFGSKPKSQMSPAEILIHQGQLLLAVEQQQARQAQQIATLEHRIDLMDGDTGYQTVTAYVRKHGWKIPLSQAKAIGLKAAKLAKDLGVQVGTVPDERWGTVNSYPISLLDEIVSDFFCKEDAA